MLIKVTLIFNKPEIKKFRTRLRNNQTEAERKLWSRLRKRQFFGYRFVRQFSIGNFIIDFYSPELRLAIELDGSQHMLEKNKSHDESRSKRLRELGIKIVRFWDNDLLNNTDGVLEQLKNYLTPPDLPFRKRGGNGTF